MLIVFNGLPGVGKSTLARELAATQRATYIRIDTIEQAIRDAKVLAEDVGVGGYGVALAVAETNLVLGRVVIVDCVNPVTETRTAWRTVAFRANVTLVHVEVIYSDLREHRRRVEARSSDIPGLSLPTWLSVEQRKYDAWVTELLVIDTAVFSLDRALSRIEEHIDSRGYQSTVHADSSHTVSA